jgi:hypothetical protein
MAIQQVFLGRAAALSCKVFVIRLLGMGGNRINAAGGHVRRVGAELSDRLRPLPENGCFALFFGCIERIVGAVQSARCTKRCSLALFFALERKPVTLMHFLGILADDRTGGVSKEEIGPPVNPLFPRAIFCSPVARAGDRFREYFYQSTTFTPCLSGSVLFENRESHSDLMGSGEKKAAIKGELRRILRYLSQELILIVHGQGWDFGLEGEYSWKLNAPSYYVKF